MNHADDVVRILRLIPRRVLDRHGDGRKQLAITELGFPPHCPDRGRRPGASCARPRSTPSRPPGSGARSRTYRLRHRLNLSTVLWFAWATSDHYRPGKDFNGGFSYMGLVHRMRSGHVRRKPALFAYYYVAHHLRARYRHHRAGPRLAAPRGLR